MINVLMPSPNGEINHSLVRETINQLIAVENAKEQTQLLAGLAGGMLFVSELRAG